MATLSSTMPTLLDIAKTLDPSTGKVGAIVELLNQTNPILDDMVWKEANNFTSHRVTIRTGLPEATVRKLNRGVPASKGTTAQIDEAFSKLASTGKLDAGEVELNGNTADYRLQANRSHIEAITQKMAQLLFYGDSISEPDQFIGLSPRYSTISGATNGQNILDGGGVGSDNLSIWLVGWGPDSVYGIYPKGTKAGVQHTSPNSGGLTELTDPNGNTYMGYADYYEWNCGITVADWRNVVRIANIDASNLESGSGAANLIDLMSDALDCIPTLGAVRPVFYLNRKANSALRKQGSNRSSSVLSVADSLTQFGKVGSELKFLGVPVRICDQLMNTEAAIS